MPGWRLGWLVAPDAHVHTIHDALINLFLTPPSLSQHAALAAMDAGVELEQSVTHYARNRTRLLAGLRALGINADAPDGAFYLYADFSRYTHDSLRLCQQAIDAIGVGMAPGVDFDPVGGQDHVRLCFAIGEAQLDEALAWLADWLPRYHD
jgi:aspartate/methionine/tyrosine aminotransferase